MAGNIRKLLRIYAAYLLVAFPLLLLLPCFSYAQSATQTGMQNGDNPFELNHRLEKPIDKKEEIPSLTPAESGNPFDIQRMMNPASKTAPVVKKAPTKTEELPSFKLNTANEKSTNFNFWMIAILVALTTFVITLFRSAIGKSYKAFTNDNVLRLLYREQNAFISWPVVLYGFFLVNAGVFIFLLIQHFNKAAIPYSNFQLLLFCILAAIVVFLAKHLLLRSLAYIFPVQKEVTLYNFTIVIFNIVLGILLVPFNLFIPFAGAGLAKGLIFIALTLISLSYLYRSLRGIFIASKFLSFNKFHFFIYLCTVEIAPMVIVVKLVLNQLN